MFLQTLVMFVATAVGFVDEAASNYLAQESWRPLPCFGRKTQFGPGSDGMGKTRSSLAVHSAMLCNLNEFEVFKPVIVFDAILMMDRQIATADWPMGIFPYRPVFEHVFPYSGDLDVAIAAFPAPSSIAFRGTVFSDQSLCGDRESFAASFADTMVSSHNVNLLQRFASG